MNEQTAQKTIGFIGLGRMGLAMTERLLELGYAVKATDVAAAARSAAAASGVDVYSDTVRMLAQLPRPSIVWIMVPSKFVDSVLAELMTDLAPGSIVIDGGNSAYGDSRRRHHELAQKQIKFLDCGTSGGVEGARTGASLMVGGEAAVYEEVKWLFAALAIENGYARVGNPGAGHFVKTVHNAIEYGMMGALAEGMAHLDERADEFDLSIPDVLKPYVHGSIISSRLLDWLAEGYRSGIVDDISGCVPVGETEEKMKYIRDHGDMPVLAAAVAQRISSREQPSRMGKYISTMRYQFGGHQPAERPEA